MSFRPQSRKDAKLLTNGTNGDAQTNTEDRLMVLTSEHQLVEFEAFEGKLSEWSRRNPKAYLPAEFKGVKDRAMGCLWDLSENRERLWLYGSSWLWMFDLKHDFPSPEEFEASEQAQEGGAKGQVVKASSAQKRKRQLQEDGENGRKKPNTGAGDRIPLVQADVYFDSKYRKVVGADESKGEWISTDQERPRGADGEDEDAYDHDEAYAASNDAGLARLRRGGAGNEEANANTTTSRKDNKRFPVVNGFVGDTQTSTRKAEDQDLLETPASQKLANRITQPPRRWWHTYKYRDILGIVPLADDHDSAEQNGEDSNDMLEVAVVERPMWDIELPGRYVRDYS